MSGNRKDLKCVVCGLWSVVCGLLSVSIDSHVQYISFSFYISLRKTYSVHYFIHYYIYIVQYITVVHYLFIPYITFIM